MAVADEFVQANQKYASAFTKGELPLPPARKVAVVVCMDARIDPARALGLEEGDAHVIAFLPFGDLDASVRDDLAVYQASPLVRHDVPVRGFVYQVESGTLREVARTPHHHKNAEVHQGGKA